MIKRHRSKVQRAMKRTTRIHLGSLNEGKAAQLYTFLCLYRNIVAYFVERFWSEQAFDAELPTKAVTDGAVAKFGITARLAQCASKQAKETIRCQRECGIKTMPKICVKTATLDGRLVSVEEFKGKHFDLCCAFGSGVPKLTVPFNKTAHFNRFANDGWFLADTIRMGRDRRKRIWVDLVFKKPRANRQAIGAVRGIDRGFRKPIAMSDGQQIGAELLGRVKVDPRINRKSYRHWLKTELNRELKKLDLSQVKALAIEDLRYVKHGKRGTFSRKVNRLLSFWFMTRAAAFLKQRSEELGFSIVLKSPWKTSQRCSGCGKIDKRSRKGETFKCVGCGSEKDADYNAALNLEYLGLAGIYSFRSLQTLTA